MNRDAKEVVKMRENLARNLRLLRAERGLSLTEVEEASGVDRNTVAALERATRGAYTPTLEKLAAFYGVSVPELIAEEAPLARKEELSKELSAQEWARQQGARMHGMTNEEWDDHVRTHDTLEGVTETWKEIHNEARMLHPFFALDKAQRPQNRGGRLELGRGLRDLRMHRYADLQAHAYLLRAKELINEIAAAMEEEARS